MSWNGRSSRPERQAAGSRRRFHPGLLVPALVAGPALIAVGALILDAAWRLGYGEWRQAKTVEAAGARAEGRIESFWWRLDFRPELLGPDGTHWGAATAPELCVRFRWRHPRGGDTPGVVCRRYPRLWDNLALLTAELAPGRPLPWLDDEGGARMELRLSRRAHDWLSVHTPRFWPLHPDSGVGAEREGSEIEALWIAVDRPVDHMIESWGAAERRIEVVYDPADLTQARPAAMLRAAGAGSPGLLIAVWLGLFGLVAWSLGWRVLLSPLSRWVGWAAALAGLAALPLWGGRLGELAGRISPGAESVVTFFATELAPSPPSLEVRSPDRGPEVDDLVFPYSLATSFYAPVLARFDLRRPAEADTEDAVLRALAADTARQVLALPAAEQAALFRTLTDLNRRDRTELGYLFLEAARRVGTEVGGEAGAAATRYLRSFDILPPLPGLPAFEAKVEQWEALVDYPDTVAANIARITLEQAREE